MTTGRSKVKHSLRFTCIAATMVAAAAIFASGTTKLKQAQMPWVRNYDSALASAKNTQRLILIDFYADWCTWCKRLDTDTFTHRSVIKLSSDVVPVRLNSETEGKALAKKYRVESLPRVILIDAKGDVWLSIQGYLPPNTFAAEIKKGLSAKAKFNRAVEVLRTNPSDVESNAILAYVESQRGQVDSAAARLNRAQKSRYKGRLLATAYNASGEAHFKLNNIEKAAELYSKALESSSDKYESAYALVSLAYCQQKLGKHKQARETCERLMKMESAPMEFVAMAKEILTHLSSTP